MQVLDIVIVQVQVVVRGIIVSAIHLVPDPNMLMVSVQHVILINVHEVVVEFVRCMEVIVVHHVHVHRANSFFQTLD